MADGKTLWVVLSANASQYERVMKNAGRDTRAFGDDVDRAGAKADSFSNEINKMSGRIRLVVDSLLLVGPAVIPITAMAIPAVAGLASQLGFLALAGGSVIASFQGVGEALKAVREAEIEPTAANLEEARLAMERLGPDAQRLVGVLQDLTPELVAMRNASAAGGFPGITQLLRDVEELSPRLQGTLFALSRGAGDAAAEIGEGLVGPRTDEFLTFIEEEAPESIALLTETVLNLTGGMAELWMTFAPVNRDFAEWLRDVAVDFDNWAQGLERTQGFEDFVDYIRDNGPKVADALGAIGNMLLQIIEAAAPLGGPTLMALEAVADVIATIADSDAGPTIMATVTALTLLSRATKGLQAAQGSSWFQTTKGNIDGMRTSTIALTAAQKDFAAAGVRARDAQTALIPSADKRAAVTAYAAAQQRVAAAEKERTAAMRAGLGTLGRGAAVMGGLAIAGSGVADKVGLANTASLALMGTMAGPWGAAVGGAVGLALDFAAAQDDGVEASSDLAATLDRQTLAVTDQTRALMANRLEQAGVLEKADALGISLEDVTSAAVGNDEAMQRVMATLDGMIVRTGTTSQGYSSLTGEEIEASNAARVLKEELQTQDGVMGKTIAGARRTAEAIGDTGTEFQQAESAAASFREEITMLNELLADRSALRSYEAALDTASATINELKDPSRLLTKGGKINIDLEKGRQVQAELDAIAASTSEVLQGLKQSERQPFLSQARRDMIDVANKLFNDRKRAAEFVDYLLRLDSLEVRPTIDAETQAAMTKVGQIQYRLQQLDGKRVTTYVDTVYTASGRRFKDVPSGVPNENGGLYVGGVRAFADGGYGTDGRYYSREPMLVKGGANILWGEKSTGWEAYISGKPGQESRNIAILGAAAGRFGLGLTRQGDRYASAGGGGNVQVRAVFPDRIILQVDGQRFTAWVRGQADAVVEHRTNQIDRAESGADRRDWR